MSTYITTGTRGRKHLVPDVASSTFVVLAGGAQTIAGLTTVDTTLAAAVSGASGRILTGSTTLPAWSSGTAMGVAGRVTGGGTIAFGSYIYGTQGKVTVGAYATSGNVAGVYGQLDVTGSTITTGNIAPVQANIYGYNSGTSTVLTGLYVEHAGGGVIQSLARFFGKSTYVFDIVSNTHPNVSLTGTPGSVTGGTGWIKVLIDGSARYIPLASSVS